MSKTHNISSSATVFLKYFLPTIWAIFFGTLLLVFVFAENLRTETSAPTSSKITFSIIFVVVLITLVFTVFRLKRVELDNEFVYITNYIKIFRYPFAAIESIKTSSFGVATVYTIELKEAGHFGKKVTFLASKKRLAAFKAAEPEAAELFGF